MSKKRQISIIVSIALLSVLTTSIDFSIEIGINQKFCFYEVYDLNQKYSFIARPHQSNKYQVQISMIDGRQWKQVFFQNNNERYTRVIKAHKLASMATTYSFCTKNLDNFVGYFNITSNSGIQVLEMHELPDLSDAQNLQRQLTWLGSQNDALKERAANLVGLRTTNQQIAMMVGGKMILFAVVGLLVILGVNFAFYRALKKTFKDRKLI